MTKPLSSGSDPIKEETMPSSFDQNLDFFDESRTGKIWRRLKEEPLVPLGLGLTTYALLGATRSIRRGNKTQTNMYFRARVYAQAFTLLCICVGSVYWKEDREKRKYYQGLLSEKKAQERRDAWIKELEAREEEDKVEREKKKRRREVAKERAEASAEGTKDKKKMEEQDASAHSVLDQGNMESLAMGKIVGPVMKLWRRNGPVQTRSEGERNRE